MTYFVAEFIGTMILVLLGNGVVANVILNGTKGNNSGWMVITTAWGVAVFVGVVIAGPYSGAHLNPIVSLGLAAIGKFAWANVPVYVVAQILGAMLGSGLVWLIYRDHFEQTKDQNTLLSAFCTDPAIRNNSSNLASEIVGTFVLVFTVFYITEARILTNDTPIGLGSIGAIPVAFLVWAIGLSLGGTTGYAINPARDLGPRIMHALLPVAGKGQSKWSYAWIPVVGPIVGAGIAAVLYLSLL